jgi:hypothetical protein
MVTLILYQDQVQVRYSLSLSLPLKSHSVMLRVHTVVHTVATNGELLACHALLRIIPAARCCSHCPALA